MKYFLAADIGGSKTIINVYNEDCVLKNSYTTLGAGLSYDSTEDIPYISELAKKISNEYSICSVAINLAGKNTEQIRKIFTKYFKNAYIDIFRESDGTAAFMLGQKYASDVILLAGTGSIALGSDGSGKYIVAGGWGADIDGDIGSGYDIGLKAVKQSVLALDGSAPLTSMQKYITGLESPITAETSTAVIRDLRDGVRKKLGDKSRRGIAAYTKTVVKFAEMGEKDALIILSEAGIDLAKIVADAAASLLPYKVKSIAVTGGLVNIKKFWKESFQEFLLKNSNITEFNYIEDGVILGTFLKAKENFKKEN